MSAEGFFRQSVRSDYCAVYATGSLLALHDVHLSRTQLLRRFGCDTRTTWRGAAPLQIASVVEMELQGARCRAERVSLRRLRRTSKPLLVAAVGRLCRNTPLRCWHAFVVLSNRRGVLKLIDPLAAPPSTLLAGNARIRLGDRSPAWLHVDGAPWEISTRHTLWAFPIYRTPHQRTAA